MPDRLHYDVHEGNGAPMLLVHGIMGGRALWTANLDALREICTPVVVELLGHGRSPSPSDLDRYRPAAYVEAFEHIRAELGVERWWMTGQSLGAALTLRYCLTHRQRVLGHVFTNSASGLADDDWVADLAAKAERDAAHIERAGVSGLRESRMNPARSPRLDRRVRDALLADVALLDPVGIANSVRATATSASVRAHIGSNTVPSLLVVGTLERGFADAHQHAAAHMAQLRIAPFAAGHSPNAEMPDEFNRVVADFVREHTR